MSAAHVYEASSGLRWAETANGHWFARGHGGDFDGVPMRAGGYALFWAPDVGAPVALGMRSTLMGLDEAAADFMRGQRADVAAEQPGKSYAEPVYFWKVTFVDASGERRFEIVEGKDEREAVEAVKAIASSTPRKFVYAKRMGRVPENAAETALAEDGSCLPCAGAAPAPAVAVVDQVEATTTHTTAVVAAEEDRSALGEADEKAALRWTEVSFDKRADAERFARFLERRHSTVVALHSGLIVTTNATHGDIQKVLGAHKWEGGHRVNPSARRYDLVSELERRSRPARKPHRPKAKRAKARPS